MDELKQICITINVDYEDINTLNKLIFINELVSLLRRTGKIPRLVLALVQERQNQEWETLFL